MRWLYVLYFIAVAIVTFVLIGRDPEFVSGLSATKTMAFNHLIREDDLGPPFWRAGQAEGPVTKDKFVGKYTSGTVREGQTLHTYEVFSTPVLGAPQSALRVAFPVKAADVRSGSVNAQQTATFCPAAGDGQAVVVLAVLCAPGLKDPCNAVFDLTAEQLAKLGDWPKTSGGHLALSSSSCK